MKVNITYSCGHEGTIEVFGKAEERERKIKWFSEYGLCPDCYKAEKQTEEKSLAEKAAIRKGAGDDFADFLDDFTKDYYQNDSASWWIDHREWRMFKKDLLGKAVTAFKAQDAL